MAQIKVSVIVPVYNVEQYLSRCLDSLVNQTLGEIEILVVNDGSPDRSQEIIDRYRERYPEKIRPFIKENGGLSDARNFGIERANGDYLAFVDSDDYVDIDMFEKLYARAKETDADVVCCPFVYDYGTVQKKRFFSGKEYLFGRPAAESPEMLKQANSYAWNKIYRLSFWQRGNYRFPKGQWFEDSALIYGLLLDADRIECVNIPFYHYVKNREDSITNRVDPRIYDIFKSCESMIAAFRAKYAEHEVLRETVTDLCVMHIFARVRELTRAKDRKLTKDFLRDAYRFLNEKLPGWKTCAAVSPQKGDPLDKRLYKLVCRHRTLTMLGFSVPSGLRKQLMQLPKLAKRIVKKLRSMCRRLLCKEPSHDETLRRLVQRDGISMIVSIQQLLRELGLVSFADFGTLLGLVREGKLLEHDKDIDIGVVPNNASDLPRLRVAMERHGFTLWRRYCLGEQIVEESYKRKDLKVDLNYYRMEENCAKTWLFYRKPGFRYEKSEQRHVVEMTYSPIREMTSVKAAGKTIVIPANAECLLEEKYGAAWKKPDREWIYWKSPAARPIEAQGHFTLFEYESDIPADRAWQAWTEQNAPNEP